MQTTLLTRRRTCPFRLDMCCPVCHEGRYDLALRFGLVQKLVIIRVTALRYTCPFAERERNRYKYDYHGGNGRNETKTNGRTDEHALTYKSAHLTARIDHKPFTQDELQLVAVSVLVVVIIIIVTDVLVLCASLKDRFGTQIVNDKVRRL